MKTIVAFFVGCLFSLNALSQPIEAPTLKAGDSWLYQITVEKGKNVWNQTHNEITVDRATPTSIYFTVKLNGSNQAPANLIAGADWSRIRDVNGQETVVNKPLDFPLVNGKTWQIQYTEQHPNKAHLYEKWDSKFTVVGNEEITVPAGKFNAIKIEDEGNWTARMVPDQIAIQGSQMSPSGVTMVTQVQRNGNDTITGRTYKAFWYVPEIKRWVKSVEEYYNKGGIMTERFTGELESFKLNN